MHSVPHTSTATRSPSKDSFASSTFHVFARPFVTGDTPHLFLQNIANTHPECMYDHDGRVLEAYNISGPLSEKGAAICAIKDTRAVLATMGNTTVNRQPDGSIDPKVQSYLDYLLAYGLIEPAHLDNLVLVDDFLDFDSVLRSAAATGRTGVAFNPAPDFLMLCNRYGVPMDGRTDHRVGLLDDKHHFRELVERSLPGTYSYPHLWVERGDRPRPEELSAIVNWLRPEPSAHNPVPILFVQTNDGSGGSGNYKVTLDVDGTMSITGRDEALSTLDDLCDFIAGLDSGVEVAPFLEVLESPSVGIVSSPQGVSFVGPFRQLLNDDGDYCGFQLSPGMAFDSFDSEVAGVLSDGWGDVTQLLEVLGGIQFDAGYYGYSNVDLFVYRDPRSGSPSISYSEMNLRYGGTCMLQMFVHTRPHLRERFLGDRLSLMQHDAVPMTKEVFADVGESTTRLAERLEQSGVPMLTGTSYEGVVIMARPAEVHGHASAGIGILAQNDETRSNLFERVSLALSGELSVG